MSQLSFSDVEYGAKRKKTKREIFLSEMDAVVPWDLMVKLIEPAYPKSSTGRPPYALSSMIRVYCMQQGYGLSDPAMEETLYEIASMRRFAGLSLGSSQRDQITNKLETLKAQVRAKVEPPFRVIKIQFGFIKARYKGMAKNKAQLHMLFALANLYMVRRRLMALG